MTTDNDRPNPDQLLTLVQHSESLEGRGKLKIYLGMAAGVGKTYAMLRAGKEALTEGRDVVVGVVETHQRVDTIKELEGLPQLPLRTIAHKDVVLQELDLDGLLVRRPELALIDELAHTNAPDTRHTKRYLDILELIQAGIDVYTTVNIQHIESRVGTVKEITGIHIQETVPDSFLDQADEIILIDIPPDSLLKRLQEGRIYPQERIETAQENFFRLGNLTALREMALRAATERVDKDLREYKQLYGIETAWKSSHRLGVTIFASPYSESLIRWTRRLADVMDATWIGIYVESTHALSEQEKILLANNMTLIHELGGEVIATTDDDVVSGITRVAKQNQVTQLIVGKSHPRFWRGLLPSSSISDRLIRNTGDIDVYCVATEKGPRPAFVSPRKENAYLSALEWIKILGIVGFSWIVALLIRPIVSYMAVGFVFLLAVSLSALFFRRLYVLIMATLFVTIHNFFFIPPLYTFTVSRAEDAMMLLMFFFTAVVMGHLTSQLKSKEHLLRMREDRTAILFSLTKTLAKAKSRDEVYQKGLDAIRKVLTDGISLYIPQINGKLVCLAQTAASQFGDEEKEKAVAQWVYGHQKPAGRFTDTLPAAEGFFVPVVGKDTIWAVLGIKISKKADLSGEKISLIETCAFQLASALDRENAQEQAKQAHFFEETQKLYRSLLDSVSHELKTPLAAIKGASSALLDPVVFTNSVTTQKLASEIVSGTNRLQQVVENLLDMTRAESGMIAPRFVHCDLDDLLSSILQKLSAEIGDREINIQNNLSDKSVLCDPGLTDQILTNILRNALTYSLPPSPVEIQINLSHPWVKIDIQDFGTGLPLENPMMVFDKFFRAHPEKAGGLGLGLSIAKSFTEAQGGKLTAENHRDRGAVFSVWLPMEHR